MRNIALAVTLIVCLFGCDRTVTHKIEFSVNGESEPKTPEEKEKHNRLKSKNDLKEMAIPMILYGTDHWANKGPTHTTIENLIKKNPHLKKFAGGKLRAEGWTYKFYLSPNKKAYCMVGKPPKKGKWLFCNADGEVSEHAPFTVDEKTCKIKK